MFDQKTDGYVGQISNMVSLSLWEKTCTKQFFHGSGRHVTIMVMKSCHGVGAFWQSLPD